MTGGGRSLRTATSLDPYLGARVERSQWRNRPEHHTHPVRRRVYVTFFRSFYLIFAGLFTILLLAAGIVALNAVRLGQPPTTIAAIVLAAMSGALVQRAVTFMRE